MAETLDSLISLTFHTYFLMRTLITGADLYAVHWLCNQSNSSVHYPSLRVESYVTEGTRTPSFPHYPSVYLP